MPKTIEEKIEEIDIKILELNEKKKNLLNEKKKRDAAAREKFLNQVGSLMESKGFKTLEEVESFLNQNVKENAEHEKSDV